MKARNTALTRIAFACLVVLLAGAPVGSAQGPTPSQGPAPVQAPPQPAAVASGVSPFVPMSAEDARLGPLDVIVVTVFDAPELSGKFTISEEGTFPMPYLGAVSALKKTPEELAAEIAGGLRDRYLKSPIVTVAVEQYFVPTYFIQGAVRSPGLHRIRGRVSLLELIATAGGLADNHGTTAFVLRESDGTAGPSAEPATAAQSYEVREINIAGLMKGNIRQPMELEPKDFVTVPPADTFYVAGEVNAPGPFSLRDGTTLRQAVSLAQGLTFNAAKSRAVIFRENPQSGQREEIRVDIGDVMSGDREDVAIAANDIIIVPHSRAKSIGGTMLQILGASVLRYPARVVPVPRP